MRSARVAADGGEDMGTARRGSPGSLVAGALVVLVVVAGCASPIDGAARRGVTISPDTASAAPGSSSADSATDSPPATTDSAQTSSAGPDDPATAEVGGETAIRVVTPFTDDRRLALDVDVANGPVMDETCGGSPLRAGMLFQCGPDARQLPACWPLYGTGDEDVIFPLLCMSGPDDEYVTEFYNSSGAFPLPAEVDDVISGAMPWQVTLINGPRCTLRMGGAWAVPPEGYAYSYGCEDHYLLLADATGQTFDRSAGRWLAWGQWGETGDIGQLQVAEAVFAGAAPSLDGPMVGDQCPAIAELAPLVGASWSAAPEVPVFCAEDWAVLVGHEHGDEEDMYGPVLLTASAGGWQVEDISGLCEVKKGYPLFLLQWCYAG